MKLLGSRRLAYRRLAVLVTLMPANNVIWIKEEITGI
jgi:hypothetical protein